MIRADDLPVAHARWRRAVRIIRSLHPPIDLFEDIADPADWPLLVAAEQKTNPRLMPTIGALDLVPPDRRVGGAGATYLMAPFTHISSDRPSRFSDGSYGMLYAGKVFETALLETVHHHTVFMRRTHEAPGWTSQFREAVLDVDSRLQDLRDERIVRSDVLNADDYTAGQALGADLRRSGSNGLTYPSVRHEDGECVGLFYPDCASGPTQGRHLDYHWNGTLVDFYRERDSGRVYEIVPN